MRIVRPRRGEYSGPHNGVDSMRGFESKHWCWWYIAIGVGFLLLAIVNTMRGAPLYATVLRVIIAIGFELLGWFQYRNGV